MEASSGATKLDFNNSLFRFPETLNGSGLTPVAGRIFENRAIFLERFFGRGIFAQNSFLGQKMSLDFK